MGKKEQNILAKLDPSIRPDESVITSNKKLQSLLEFPRIGGKGQTTDDSRVEIQAILVSAVNSGMPLNVAAALKETLTDLPPKRTADLLGELNTPNASPKAVLSSFTMENQVGAKLEEVDTATLTEVTIKPPNVVQVSPETGQNLDVAHSVNFAVKSIITDGAPNQAPDVFRTSGRNFLLDKERNTRGSKLTEALEKDKQYRAECGRASEVDKKRGKKAQLGFGEDYNNVVTKSQGTAAVGTGKCAEHAVTAFSILSDPKSLAKLGVQLAEGSTVMLVRGDMIDHSYVLIAGPGAVKSIDDGGDRRVVFNDPKDVVVVDPWMPLPVAHTLDRCNAEIQTNPPPMCKMAVVIEDGKSMVLDRGGVKTQLPDPKVPVIDQLNTIKEKYRPIVLDIASKQKMGTTDQDSNLTIVPDDKDTRLAVACGQAATMATGKSGMYTTTHLSTDTPEDQYQCVTSTGNLVGQPKEYFVANLQYLDTEYQFIDLAKKTSVESVAFKPESMDLMPKDLRARVEILHEARQDQLRKQELDSLALSDHEADQLMKALNKLDGESDLSLSQDEASELLEALDKLSQESPQSLKLSESEAGDLLKALDKLSPERLEQVRQRSGSEGPSYDDIGKMIGGLKSLDSDGSKPKLDVPKTEVQVEVGTKGSMKLRDDPRMAGLGHREKGPKVGTTDQTTVKL